MDPKQSDLCGKYQKFIKMKTDQNQTTILNKLEDQESCIQYLSDRIVTLMRLVSTLQMENQDLKETLERATSKLTILEGTLNQIGIPPNHQNSEEKGETSNNCIATDEPGLSLNHQDSEFPSLKDSNDFTKHDEHGIPLKQCEENEIVPSEATEDDETKSYVFGNDEYLEDLQISGKFWNIFEKIERLGIVQRVVNNINDEDVPFQQQYVSVEEEGQQLNP